MQWDEDVDLLVGKKSAPKQGRRSNKNLENTEIILETDDAPTRTKKMGLWGDESSKTSRSDAGRNIIELERFQNEKKTDFNDDIPIIPDIDDAPDDLNLQDLKLTTSVDKSANKISGLKLDQSKIGKLDDIDLSCLINRLYPEKDVQECADIWTLDSLFNDLSRDGV